MKSAITQPHYLVIAIQSVLVVVCELLSRKEQESQVKNAGVPQVDGEVWGGLGQATCELGEEMLLCGASTGRLGKEAQV